MAFACAVVTGANRGIGAALKAGLEAQGSAVIGTSRNPGSGLVTCDVANPDGFEALHAAVAGTALDLLVCNAGVYLDRGNRIGTGYPAADWARTFAVNVTGVFLTIQALLPALLRGRGRIAVISSAMGSDARAPGGSYIYRASKAAALNLGRNLATDLKAQGIAVGIYHPGWVRTEMGGADAEIAIEDSVQGLLTRFAALDLARTGCFETWDGQALPF